MPDIDRNIDDLFCKAAQNYRPKPSESNWSKIASQLSSGPVVPPASQKNNNNKKYFLILSFLLLFLFAGGLLTKYAIDKNITAVLEVPSKAASNSSDKEQGNVEKKGKAIFKKLHKEGPSTSKKDYSLKEDHTREHYNLLPIKKSKYDGSIVVLNAKKNSQSDAYFSTIKDDTNNRIPVLMNENNVRSLLQNKSVTKKKADRADNSNKVISPVLKQRGLYFGAEIGASFNSVKYQGFKKPGFDIGAIAGYQLNDRISFETGLFFGKKHYFSKGEYFSMDKVGSSMPPQMKIVSLEGSSTLFEIPLKFTYSILQKKKTAICSSVGLSSYLLTKEKNNYLTLMNGTSENIIGLYDNSSRYFAAAMNFSISYQYKFSNNKNIRIEPYFQIPLKGIGMGTLPVMSVGLHVGFSAFLH